MPNNLIAFFKLLWSTEPVIVSLVGSGAVWAALFGVCGAFGYPLSPTQQTALLALLGALGAALGRSQVSPVSSNPSNPVEKV